MQPWRSILVLCLCVASGFGGSCQSGDATQTQAAKNSSETPPTPSSGEGSGTPQVDATPTIHFETAKGEVSIEVEVVQTPGKIQRGLMYRQHMPADHGMLFIFASERVRSFWMKNTYIPLDMLFVTADKKIAGIVRNAEPRTLESRTIGIPTQYVIEVNAGWCDAHGVDTGASVRFVDLPKITNPPQ